MPNSIKLNGHRRRAAVISFYNRKRTTATQRPERSLPRLDPNTRARTMAVQLMPTDPNLGIPDLISRLKDDSKRLVADEVRLAKLELHESVQQGGTGAMYLAIAFGVAVIAAVMVTLLFVTLVGRAANGHMWIGALLTGIVELVVGVWLMKRGFTVVAESAKRASS
jgi:hypothetical protein